MFRPSPQTPLIATPPTVTHPHAPNLHPPHPSTLAPSLKLQQLFRLELRNLETTLKTRSTNQSTLDLSLDSLLALDLLADTHQSHFSTLVCPKGDLQLSSSSYTLEFEPRDIRLPDNSSIPRENIYLQVIFEKKIKSSKNRRFASSQFRAVSQHKLATSQDDDESRDRFRATPAASWMLWEPNTRWTWPWDGAGVSPAGQDSRVVSIELLFKRSNAEDLLLGSATVPVADFDTHRGPWYEQQHHVLLYRPGQHPKERNGSEFRAPPPPPPKRNDGASRRQLSGRSAAMALGAGGTFAAMDFSIVFKREPPQVPSILHQNLRAAARAREEKRLAVAAAASPTNAPDNISEPMNPSESSTGFQPLVRATVRQFPLASPPSEDPHVDMEVWVSLQPIDLVVSPRWVQALTEFLKTPPGLVVSSAPKKFKAPQQALDKETAQSKLAERVRFSLDVHLAGLSLILPKVSPVHEFDLALVLNVGSASVLHEPFASDSSVRFFFLFFGFEFVAFFFWALLPLDLGPMDMNNFGLRLQAFCLLFWW
jgi:hypothetical protein